MSYLLQSPRRLIAGLIAAAVPLFVTVGAAQNGVSSAAATATRADAPPVLDGRADDAAWTRAQAIDSFLEYEPKEGAEPALKTEVRVVYDDRYLYVLARMHDPSPDSIISLLSRRDVRTNSDQLTLLIDSYHDKRTGFTFGTNPAGVKRDLYVSNDGDHDQSWDAVWDVEARVDSLGWLAEFRIPFSQLRFAPGADQTFGLLITRDVARTGQRMSWPLLRRSVTGYVSKAGTLTGINALPTPRRLELTPYLVAKNFTRDYGTSRPDGLARYEHPSRLTAGADLKFGLSSNLTLDATINPDFGQVEADPAQLNLTAFETFQSERRPFFLEGAGIFGFNTSCGDIDSGCTGLFYSRRIGRSPQLAGRYGDATSPTATNIAGAAKLTGRLANGISVGLLEAVTRRVDGVATIDDRIAAIEPRTNYAVLRLQKDNAARNGDIGLMLTGVNRALDAAGSPYLRSAAYTGGLDARRRFVGGNYEVRSYVAFSDVRGSQSSIAELQRNNVHAFQRPDDEVEYDPTRTALRGHAERISVSKFGGGVTRFQSVYQRFSPGFETNDLGYQQRADEQLFRNWFAFQLQNPTRWYRRAFFNFNAMQRWTTEGLVLGNNLNQNAHIQFPNQWWIHFGSNFNDLVPAYSDRDARGGPAVRVSPSRGVFVGFESDSRPAVSGRVFGGVWRGDGGRSSNRWVNPGVEMRVSSRFSGSVGAYYEQNKDDSQFYRNFGDVGSDTASHTFARLDQTTFNLNVRLNFTATPNLSIQLYGQPFTSTGTYSDWRELNQPRAASYEDRFRPYRATAGDFDGFNSRQFRSNAVLRYEYRPGSTLFVVWQQGRSSYLVPGDAGYNDSYEVRRDYDAAFWDHPSNTLLIKWSYWLNP